MPKALSKILCDCPQTSAARRAAALGAALAAALLLDLAAGEAAAAARAAERTPPAPRAGEAVRPVGWDHHGQRSTLYRVPPPVAHQGAHHQRFHKPQALHGHRHQRSFHSHRHGHKKLQHRGRRHYGLACRPVRVVGWHHGHRALFGQVLCVNRFGQHSLLRGSRYLIRYLRH